MTRVSCNYIMFEHRHPSMYIHPSAEAYKNTIADDEVYFCHILGTLITHVGRVLVDDPALRSEFVDKYSHPRMRAVKNYISAKATEIIKTLPLSEDNNTSPPMRFASKRQINKLLRKHPCDVTCYAAIIVYVCISILLQHKYYPTYLRLKEIERPISTAMIELQRCMKAIVSNNADNQDKLAIYLLQCMKDVDRQYTAHGYEYAEFSFNRLPGLYGGIHGQQ